MKKINKDQRFVASVEKINYKTNESEKTTICNIVVNVKYQNKPIFNFNTKAKAISIENTQEFDFDFGKTLARAKAEMKMYKDIKKKIINTICNNISTKSFNNDKAIKDAIIILNTIQFCNKMIKHQIAYINKIIKNKFPND